MEDRWLTWAKRLEGLAAAGAHFTRDEYDRERYREIGAIAREMLSALVDTPVDRVASLLSEGARGYPTPKIDVRGAVFSEMGILLVREGGKNLWSLPGGFADIGLSPSENIVKEVLEEAQLQVRATALYALRHKAKHGYAPDVRDFYKLFFLCEPTAEAHARAGPEIDEVGFFPLDRLPPLSTGRVIEDDIAAAFACRAGSRPCLLTFD
jgi:ADP-ribose pyrophosphatase YjhB (NUDIX family)